MVGLGSRFTVVALAVLVMVSAVSVVFSVHQARGQVFELQLLREQATEQQERRGQLLLEQSAWGSYTRIERLARERLLMGAPTPEQIWVMKL